MFHLVQNDASSTAHDSFEAAERAADWQTVAIVNSVQHVVYLPLNGMEETRAKWQARVWMQVVARALGIEPLAYTQRRVRL